MIYKRLNIEKIKIKNLFDKLEIANKENEIKEIPFPLKIKTPYGYNKIVTAFRTEKQKAITTYFKNNHTLKTSENHLLKTNGEWKKVKDLNESDIIETEFGTTSIIRKHEGNEEILYDISVENVHCYYSNGILSHNSWVLAKLGAEAMKQGKNVLHITLELNENYVGLRYDSCFTGIDFQNIRNNIDIVKKKIEAVPGKLFIKYFPIKTVSPNSLKLHAERIKMLGTKIDMMVVDYADILRPAMAEKNSNSYSEAGSVYEELRAVAGELQIPIWSASQANRSAAEEDIVLAHHAADSYRKIMTADFVMSLSRKTADKVANTARVHIIKNRFGADGVTFPCRMNASCGDIQVFSENSREGVAVLNEMGQEENIVKKAMFDKYKTLMEEDEEN
jgi:DnaB-like helicase C terminal domain